MKEILDWNTSVCIVCGRWANYNDKTRCSRHINMYLRPGQGRETTEEINRKAWTNP